jgi:hypothetical protein
VLKKALAAWGYSANGSLTVRQATGKIEIWKTRALPILKAHGSIRKTVEAPTAYAV